MSGVRLSGFIVLFYLFMLGACGSSAPSEQLQYEANGDRWPLFESRSWNEQVKILAALSGSVYCGDGESCTVQGRFQENAQKLGVSWDWSGWRFELVTARDLEKDVEGYVIHHPQSDDVFLAFRGSEGDLARGALQDWLKTNALVLPKYFGGKQIQGQVHMGYLEAMYGIWHPNETGLIRVLQAHNLWGKRFWLTGHSQGAAVAILVAMRLADDNNFVAGVFTYGAPRLAQYDFQWSYNQRLGERTYQFANPLDPVPRVPWRFVAVGRNYLLGKSYFENLGKDGASAWDPVNALIWGRGLEHTIDPSNGLSYLERLRLVGNGAGW